MKTCVTCKESKPLADFPPNRSKKDGLNIKCRVCFNAYMRAWYQQPENHAKHIARTSAINKECRDANRQSLWDYYSTHPCVHCGETDPIVLQFDHVDRSTKLYSIAKLIARNWAWETILKEIEKCRVLCANCHARVTAEQFGWYKNVNKLQ